MTEKAMKDEEGNNYKIRRAEPGSTGLETLWAMPSDVEGGEKLNRFPCGLDSCCNLMPCFPA